MDRDEFIEHVKKNSQLTKEDKILIPEMNKIAEYAKSISKTLDGENTDDQDYYFFGGDNEAQFKYNDFLILFKREEGRIRVQKSKVGTDPDTFNNFEFDSLDIQDGKVYSKKYNEVLSESLLNKYLDELVADGE